MARINIPVDDLGEFTIEFEPFVELFYLMLDRTEEGRSATLTGAKQIAARKRQAAQRVKVGVKFPIEAILDGKIVTITSVDMDDRSVRIRTERGIRKESLTRDYHKLYQVSDHNKALIAEIEAINKERERSANRLSEIDSEFIEPLTVEYFQKNRSG